VLKTSVLEFPASNILSDHRYFQYEIADELPEVPVLPETLLTMEFQLQERSVDLGGFTEVVLGDLGATIQILRLAGREYGSADECPARMADCIADLGLTACFNAAASGTFARGAQQRADFEIWTHSRDIAKYCRMLADEKPASINPDQAYIAGLLHAMGALPHVLGWDWHAADNNPRLAALKLAEQWRFPRYLQDFFCEGVMPGYNPHWSEFLAVAHRITQASWVRCPLVRGVARSIV
jgi:HD-like signal output (HDOD) protein